MKLRMLTAAAVLSLSFAGAAWADGKITASLKTPVSAKTKVVAGGAVFTCEGSSCIALVAPSRAASAAGCKALAKEVGALTAYGTDKKAVEGAELAACNANAN